MLSNKHASQDTTFRIERYPAGVAGNNRVLYMDVDLTAGETWEADGVIVVPNTDQIWIIAGHATTLDADYSATEDNTVL